MFKSIGVHRYLQFCSLQFRLFRIHIQFKLNLISHLRAFSYLILMVDFFTIHWNQIPRNNVGISAGKKTQSVKINVRSGESELCFQIMKQVCGVGPLLFLRLSLVFFQELKLFLRTKTTSIQRLHHCINCKRFMLVAARI